MNNTKNKKFPLYIGIGIILLLLLLRFCLFYLRSDGFSGLSMLLPVRSEERRVGKECRL